MVTAVGFRLIRAPLILAAFHTVPVRGHGGSKVMETVPIAHFNNTTSSVNMTLISNRQSYFAYTDHSALMLAHIAFMTIGWFFVLPMCTPRVALLVTRHCN